MRSNKNVNQPGIIDNMVFGRSANGALRLFGKLKKSGLFFLSVCFVRLTLFFMIINRRGNHLDVVFNSQ